MSNNILPNNKEIIQDFVDTTIEVLSTMSSLDVKLDNMIEIDGNPTSKEVTSCLDITGVLGFSGGRRGSLLISFPSSIALTAVGGMLGIELHDVDAEVTDGISELVNMVAGGAKTRLQSRGVDFDLSIPNTVIGFNHQITAAASTSRTRINFTVDDTAFFVEVYLKEE